MFQTLFHEQCDYSSEQKGTHTPILLELSFKWV